MQAPLDFFLPRCLLKWSGFTHRWLCISWYFSWALTQGDLDKSTGVLGNICGPVLCDGRKGQTEKKGGHLPHTLHLKLVMLAVSTGHANLDLAGWLAALSFLSSSLGSSDFTEVAVAHYSLQVKHKGPGLRSSALLNSFHLELLAFSHFVKSSSPLPHPLLIAREKRPLNVTGTSHYRSNRPYFPLGDRSNGRACFCSIALLKVMFNRASWLKRPQPQLPFAHLVSWVQNIRVGSAKWVKRAFKGKKKHSNVIMQHRSAEKIFLFFKS